MARKRFEVTLEKVERIRVVVEAEDEKTARTVAFETERRGEVDSISERAIVVVDVKELCT